MKVSFRRVISWKGVYTVNGAGVYRGHFVDGQLSGAGEYRDNETHYRGNFDEGLFDGQGQLRHADFFYKGEFRHGQFHGEGRHVTDDEDFQGFFSARITSWRRHIELC